MEGVARAELMEESNVAVTKKRTWAQKMPKMKRNLADFKVMATHLIKGQVGGHPFLSILRLGQLQQLLHHSLSLSHLSFLPHTEDKYLRVEVSILVGLR